MHTTYVRARVTQNVPRCTNAIKEVGVIYVAVICARNFETHRVRVHAAATHIPSS